MGSSVKKIQSEASKIQDKFQTEVANEIVQKENEVVNAYLKLEDKYEQYQNSFGKIQDANQ